MAPIRNHPYHDHRNHVAGYGTGQWLWQTTLENQRYYFGMLAVASLEVATEKYYDL